MNIERFLETPPKEILYNEEMLEFVLSKTVQQQVEDEWNALLQLVTSHISKEKYTAFLEVVKRADDVLMDEIEYFIMMGTNRYVYSELEYSHSMTHDLIEYSDVFLQDDLLSEGVPYEQFLQTMLDIVLKSVMQSNLHFLRFDTKTFQQVYEYDEFDFGEVYLRLKVEEDGNRAKFDCFPPLYKNYGVGDYKNNVYLLRRNVYSFMMLLHALEIELPEHTQLLNVPSIQRSDEVTYTVECVSYKNVGVMFLFISKLSSFVKELFERFV